MKTTSLCKVFAFFFITFLFANNLQAQNKYDYSEKIKPSWMLNDIPQSENYTYYVGYGENDSLHLAYKAAFANVLEKISDEKKISFDVKSIAKQHTVNSENNEKVDFKSDFEYSGTIATTGEKITLTGLKEVEKYWYKENSHYKAYVLMRIPKGNDKDLPIYVYDSGQKWRSAILAGWGQLYNRDKAKGIALMTGEVTCVAGIVVFHVMATNYNTDYLSYIKKGDSKNANVSKSNRDNMKLGRNVCIVAAGGIYIYNLIDALTTKGNKNYANNSSRFKIYPEFDVNNAFLCINYSFK
jgi:hypothetical protein